MGKPTCHTAVSCDGARTSTGKSVNTSMEAWWVIFWSRLKLGSLRAEVLQETQESIEAEMRQAWVLQQCSASQVTSKLKNQDIAEICKQQFLENKDSVAVSAAPSHAVLRTATGEMWGEGSASGAIGVGQW